LAAEVRYWGNWVLERVKAEISDLYPLIPDPAHQGRRQTLQTNWLKEHAIGEVPAGYLMRLLISGRAPLPARTLLRGNRPAGQADLAL